VFLGQGRHPSCWKVGLRDLEGAPTLVPAGQTATNNRTSISHVIRYQFYSSLIPYGLTQASTQVVKSFQLRSMLSSVGCMFEKVRLYVA
jgi:hypothetical protein